MDQSINDKSLRKNSMSTDYVSLFWAPSIINNMYQAEKIVEEMLSLLSEFHEQDSQVTGSSKPPKRRKRIFDTMQDTEAKATRVDVVFKSDDTKSCILTILRNHFLFSTLSENELDDVVDAMQDCRVREGDVIIKEGDPGDCFYILEEGICEIYISDRKEGEITTGFFGDLSLMYNCPRAATVIAKTDCILWSLDRVFFRQAQVTSNHNHNYKLNQRLKAVPIFENLETQSLHQLGRSLTKQSFETGEYILRQGEPGEQFYVILSGTVKITRTGDTGEETLITTLGEGEFFGEGALIRKVPRAANVVALGPVECYYLNSQDFSLIFGEIVEKLKLTVEYRVLKNAPILQMLGETELKELISIMQRQQLFEYQRVLPDPFMMVCVLEGQLMTSDNTIYKEGDVIGNMEMGADKIAGSLVVKSDFATIGIFSPTILKEYANKNDDRTKTNSSTMSGILKITSELNQRHASRVTAYRVKQPITEIYSNTTKKDISRIFCLSKGVFGSLYKSKHSPSGNIIAVKSLDKDVITRNGHEYYIKREISALQCLNHPFIMNYYGVILCSKQIHLMMEYIPGIDLWSYLYSNENKHNGPYGALPLASASMYAANILLALEHIHSQGFCYRDLKPENIIITTNGYLKLVDFMFTKPIPYYNSNNNNSIQYRTYTLCGTPEYMAPEIVLTLGHDNSVDFWAFGILMYELLCKTTPFEGNNIGETFEKITHSQKTLRFPPNFDSFCRSFIRRLLHHNPSLRLGTLQNGIDDIKSQSFFITQNIDFDIISNCKGTMPFIPNSNINNDNNNEYDDDDDDDDDDDNNNNNNNNNHDIFTDLSTINPVDDNLPILQ